MQFKYISYSIRVLVRTNILAPIVWLCWMYIEDPSYFEVIGEFIGGYFVVMIFGGLVSLPVFILLFFLSEVVFQYFDNIFSGKTILSIFAIVSTLVVAFFYFDDYEAFRLTLAYSFSALFSIWYVEPFPTI